MKKVLSVLAVSFGVVAIAMTTAFASEYDIDNMTPEEMKEAITTLESEKAELEDQVKDLKVQLFDLQQGAGEIPETAAETEVPVETEAEKVFKTTEEFLEDIVTSLDTRNVVSNRYTSAEEAMMTTDESWAHLSDCAEAERNLYDEYQNASFEDLNIQYLCRQYMAGLEKQYQAVKDYNENKDDAAASVTWQSGYYNRSYVIVELADYYGLEFNSDSLQDMRADTESMDSLNEAETRNAAVDHETVRKTQELLNTIGFFCGNADGISGKRTVKSIKRFQEMYGYDPIDGMIDDELIGQLEEVAAQKAPVEETETEG